MKGETPERQAIVAVTAPFAVVGDATGEELTLKALEVKKATATATDISPMNFTLQFIDIFGDVATIDDEEIYPPVADLDPDDEDDVIFAQFGILTPEYKESKSIAAPAGWYLFDDVGTYAYPMNDFPIPMGYGFCIKADNKGSAYLSYAGQVLNTKLGVFGERQAIIATGNATPVDLKLKDFTVEKLTTTAVDISPMNFTLQFIDIFGDVATIDDEEIYPPVADLDPDDEEDVIFAQFGILTPEYKASKSIAAPAGWYLFDDVGTYAYPMNEYDIPAGSGFCIRADNKGSAKIIIPNPLEGVKD